MTGLPLNIDIQQILLHMFNFIILAGGLYILLYKPVKDFMEKREAYFKERDEAVNAAEARAHEKELEYQSKLDGAGEEIAELKNKAAQEARAEADRTIAAAHEKAEKVVRQAQEDAEREHDRIIEDSRSEVAALAAAAAQKILDEGDDYASFAASLK